MTNVVRTWDAGRVKRFHTKQTLQEQNIADHSWGVVQLLLHFWPNSRKEVMIAALDHDLPELITGDIPGGLKRDHPEISQLFDKLDQEYLKTEFYREEIKLEEYEKIRLKFVDLMELFIFSSREIELGNKRFGLLKASVLDRLNDLVNRMDAKDREAVISFLIIYCSEK